MTLPERTARRVEGSLKEVWMEGRSGTGTGKPSSRSRAARVRGPER